MIFALFGTLSGIFAIAGYAPYIAGTLRGRVKPHLYSWLVWSMLHVVAVAAVMGSGGGWAATAGLAVGTALCFFETGLAMVYGTRDIRPLDKWFLAGGLAAIGLYLNLSDPAWAVALICIIDAMGFVPTLMKSWRAPTTEHPALYACSAFANAFALLALESWTFATAAYPASLTVTNVFCVWLILASPSRGRVPAAEMS